MNESDYILFDEVCQTPEMKALKAAIPYLEPSVGRVAAVMVKMLEIRAVMTAFDNELAVQAAAPGREKRVLMALRPYCDGKTAEMADFMAKMLDMCDMAEMMNAASEVAVNNTKGCD